MIINIPFEFQLWPLEIELWPFEFRQCYIKIGKCSLCYGFSFTINKKWTFHLGIGRMGRYDRWKVWVNFYKIKSTFEYESRDWKNH